MFLRFDVNIAINKIKKIFLFQFPYVLGQFSLFFTRFISKRTIMIIVTFFERIFTSTIVIFISSCTSRCFVNKAFRKTVTIHRAICFSMAIASFGSRWCWIFYNFRIVFLDDIVHVRHTTIT